MTESTRLRWVGVALAHRSEGAGGDPLGPRHIDSEDLNIIGVAAPIAAPPVRSGRIFERIGALTHLFRVDKK